MFPRPHHCKAHYVPDFHANYGLGQALVSIQNKHILTDLIRGDLVVFYSSDGADRECIFTGTELIDLATDIDGSKCVPSEFHVIENKVPILYWYNSKNQHGIDGNNRIWFNHVLVQKECCENLCYGIAVGNKYAFFTTFSYEGVRYRIIFVYSERCQNSINPKTLNFHEKTDKLIIHALCLDMLKSSDPIRFASMCTDYIEDDRQSLFAIL